MRANGAKIVFSSVTAGLRAAKLSSNAASASIADIALVGAGVAAASASLAFAILMMAAEGGAPRVNGLEYLAIFAQPNGAAKPESAGMMAETRQGVRFADQRIDPLPTGSINKGGAIAPIRDDGFHIIGGRSDLVWIRRGQTISAVRPGDIIDGLGRVGSIVRRGGNWVLLDSSGVTLPANGASAFAGDAPSRLSRSLIFD